MVLPWHLPELQGAGEGTPATDAHGRAVRVRVGVPDAETGRQGAAAAALLGLRSAMPRGRAALRRGSRGGLAVQGEGCRGLLRFVAAF